MKKNQRIAICVSDNQSYSETFIKAHIDHLKVEVIYRKMLPKYEKYDFKNTHSLLKSWLKNKLAERENKKKENELKRFFSRNNIGVVLAEYGHIGVAVLRICEKNKIPLVVHFHGFDAYKKETLITYREAYQDMFRYASALIVVSKDMEKQLLKLGAPPDKITYNVYGVDINTFRQTTPGKNPPDFLFVGRFVEKKAPYLAILSFKKVIETNRDARLLMAGDGPLLDVCRNLVRALKIEKNVIFLGSKSHQEVMELMKKSRAYIQHSIVPESGDSEGTPNSVLEALASGLPVVSTSHAGIKDIVQHDVTGYLVEECDIDGMAEYVIKLAENSDLATDIGNRSREYSEKNLSLKTSLDKLNEILIRAMN